MTFLWLSRICWWAQLHSSSVCMGGYGVRFWDDFFLFQRSSWKFLREFNVETLYDILTLALFVARENEFVKEIRLMGKKNMIGVQHGCMVTSHHGIHFQKNVWICLLSFFSRSYALECCITIFSSNAVFSPCLFGNMPWRPWVLEHSH